MNRFMTDNNFGRETVKAQTLQVIHFFDKKAPYVDGTKGREVILLYVLGEDGIPYEFANGKWTPLPVYVGEPAEN
jgi:hypothetical protein